MAVWTNEWENLPEDPNWRPKPGSPAEQLFKFLDEKPTPYKPLWIRAGFKKDPFLRTDLRKGAKAGLVNRMVEDEKELWSLPKRAERTPEVSPA
jgi:hypothetical protein